MTQPPPPPLSPRSVPTFSKLALLATTPTPPNFLQVGVVGSQPEVFVAQVGAHKGPRKEAGLSVHMVEHCGVLFPLLPSALPNLKPNKGHRPILQKGKETQRTPSRHNSGEQYE